MINRLSAKFTDLASGHLCREMDMTLTQLAAGLPVDVMPGEGDPASAALPQQPLHRYCRCKGIAGRDARMHQHQPYCSTHRHVHNQVEGQD